MVTSERKLPKSSSSGRVVEGFCTKSPFSSSEIKSSNVLERGSSTCPLNWTRNVSAFSLFCPDELKSEPMPFKRNELYVAIDLLAEVGMRERTNRTCISS